MSKITYTDKVALNINPDVADVNKCNATDLNEIKQVVNENDDDFNTLNTNVGDITQLTTPVTSSIVGAINSIVESGSNANGSYVKFTDGTMICNGKKEITTTRNTSYGSLYVSPKISAIQYPQTFLSIDSIILNAESSGNSVWLLSADLGTLTSTPTYYIAGATSAGSNTYYINFQAIGRWK